MMEIDLDDPDDRASRFSPLRGFYHAAETFHQILMEDFRFMEAARMESGEYEGATLSTEDLKPMSKVKALMLLNSESLVNFTRYSETLEHISQDREDFVIATDFRTRRFITRMSIWPPLPIFCRWVLGTKLFHAVMLCVIFLNSVLMAFDGEFEQDTNKHSRAALDSLDFFFLVAFLSEILLKWIDNLEDFWRECWNVFDFIVTVMSLIAPILDVLTQATSDDDRLVYIIATVKYIRILRILRSLNVVTRIEKIMIIWGAIARTAWSLMFITILMFIFFFIFAVIGIQIFEKFTRSHRTDLPYNECFRDIGGSMVTLFQLFTLDKWYPIILSLGSGMEDISIPLIYCMIWILLGSFIFRNIFVGVMVNNFQSIRQEFLYEREIELMDEEHLEDMEVNISSLRNDYGRTTPFQFQDYFVDWEEEVFHSIELLNLCDDLELSPVLWPRDTLFAYYILIESLSWNVDERDVLYAFINTCLMACYDDP